MPAKAVAAYAGRETVVSSLAAALGSLDDVVNLPRSRPGLAVLHPSSREHKRIAAEVAMAGGFGEDCLQSFK